MTKLYSRACLLICIVFMSVFSAVAQPVLSYTSKITGLSSPVDVVNAGDGTNRLFVVQQTGEILVYNSALVLLGNFLTVSGISTGGERGLLSLAFHPDYENNGFFYVYYTTATVGSVEIARYHVSADPDVADPTSKKVMLTIPHPGQANHNGGKLNFDANGFLFFATGDGGGSGDGSNNAQTLTSRLGKMMRIFPNLTNTAPYYDIPADNPFKGNASGIPEEIWASGLRNPFRWSFDRANGNMWLADVGQDAWEELNVIPAGTPGGLNFGWRCYEGTHNYNTAGCQPIGSYQAPIFEYPHNNATGGFAITGGFVYRGTEYSALQGYYICADYVSGNQWKIKQTGPATYNIIFQAAASVAHNISAFGEAENGTLYAASLPGVIYKVDVSAVLPVRLVDFIGQNVNDHVILRWKTSSEVNLAQFEIEYSTNGINYQRVGIVPANNSSNGSSYEFEHHPTETGRGYYRLRMVDVDGKQEFSAVVSLQRNRTSGNFIFPSLITTGTMTVLLNEPFTSVEITGANGILVMKRSLNGQTGRMEIPVSTVAAGSYIVSLKSKDRVISQRVMISK